LGEIPEPILFNTWKHHAGALRQRIQESVLDGESGLIRLSSQVAVLGNELMDLYLGDWSPTRIAEEVTRRLREQNRFEEQRLRDWLMEQGGYAVLSFENHPTQWVVRMGAEQGRYIHVHPARWSPGTRRVRANVLKTAVLVSAYVLLNGGEPFEIKLVNDVRVRYLGLSPMRKVDENQGLKPVLELFL